MQVAECLGAELDELEAVVDRVAASDPGEMPDAELSEALVALSRVRSRLEGIEARVTGVWDARQVWAGDGARSGAAWLAQRCRTPRSGARAQVALARALRAMPRTAEALVAGQIGSSQARRLGRACRRTPELFSCDEAQLLDHAETLSYSHFDRAVAYWEQLADPDGAERDARALHDTRSFHLSQTFEGAWAIGGTGDPIGGTIISEVLSRIDDELFEADWTEAKARLGDAVTVADLARTPAQRRFDALVEMAERAATTSRDGKAPRPLFTVLVDYPTLPGRVCELANGTVITPGQLVPWLTETDFERVVFDGLSRVIDVGPRRRLFTGATRRAVEVRDRFCTGLGCDEPADRCDIDHVVPYAAGGLTVQANGRVACPAHNPGRRKRRTRPPGPDPPG